MNAGNSAQPPSADGWVAAVHAFEDDFEPLGSALVLDTYRVLTCAHVVMSEGVIRELLWVAFPKAGGCPRRRVASVVIDYARPVRDLAVLMLEDPIPGGVEPAPLRCPKGQDLVTRGWWAFGFPDHDPVGDSADGQVGASLSYGWVRLDTSSRYLIRPGFSGGALWAPDYGAVVGIVGQAHANGDGRAITLHQADLDLPDLKLAALAAWSVEAAGEGALTQWGWALARDTEGMRHWRPRARGVSIDSERGWRFRGRAAAVTRIVSWLDRPQLDRRVLVITGSPGAGKSAVLGRIVTTADTAIGASLPSGDTGVLASAGSVSCAVHAKGKTALDVAEEIARAASATLPDQPDDLAPAILEAIRERPGKRFNVVIDALDEAASPSQARMIIDSIVLPLAETCSSAGVQLIVGTRRRDDGGDILSRFGGALDMVDLDDPEYFAEEDLAAYALACLQLVGDERPGNPYANSKLAVPLANRIAQVSGKNFLIAGLIARSHGLHDMEAADPERLRSPATVNSALVSYLQPLSDAVGVPAMQLLTALAFAEAPGFPGELWQLAVEALFGMRVSTAGLARFARSSAANFLVESTGSAPSGSSDPVTGPVYRLFHQALNDALLQARVDLAPRADDERALTRSFIKRGQATQWRDVPEYLLHSLPGHAHAGGLAGQLLTDDAYLLYADLRRLMQIADDAALPGEHRRIRLLRLTPRATIAGARERAALFSITEALDNLGTVYRADRWRAPYRAQWATVHPRSERAVLEGHQGLVWAVCSVTVKGRSLLASGGDDHTVRLWDPASGEQVAVLTGHRGRVWAVCSVTIKGRSLLATGDGEAVRLWDPGSGEQLAVLTGHQGRVNAVCAVTADGRSLLASGGEDGTVRLWDPGSGEQLAVLTGHRRAVFAVCAVTADGRSLLASGGQDGTVRLWDPGSGEQLAVLTGHRRAVFAVCAVTADGRSLLASGGDDHTMRLWDPASGEQLTVLTGQGWGWVHGVCAVTVDGRSLLAFGDGEAVRLWDPASGEQLTVLTGHQGLVWAVCAVTADGRSLLASGGDDQTVRLWDPASGEQLAVPEGRKSRVNAVCAVTADGRSLLASGGEDGTVRLRDPASGEQLAILTGHWGAVFAVCAVTADGRSLLASGGEDGTVRLWDPGSGEQLAVLTGHRSQVNAVCAVTADGRSLLASGGEDGTVRLWDPGSGEQLAVLTGHRGAVSAMCMVTVDTDPLLASANSDGTVRLWDPRSGKTVAVLTGDHGLAWAVCAVTVDGCSLLAIANGDGTVRLWDPRSGKTVAVLTGHWDQVNAVCAVTVEGRSLLASGGDDGTVRLWDTRTGICVSIVPTHYRNLGVVWIADSLAISLNAGILVIKPNDLA